MISSFPSLPQRHEFFLPVLSVPCKEIKQVQIQPICKKSCPIWLQDVILIIWISFSSVFLYPGKLSVIFYLVYWIEYVFSLYILFCTASCAMATYWASWNYYYELQSAHKESCLNSRFELNYGQNSVFFITACLYHHIKCVLYVIFEYRFLALLVSSFIRNEQC